jgi:hypothetical protein
MNREAHQNEPVDVLIVAALKMEYEAIREAGRAAPSAQQCARVRLSTPRSPAATFDGERSDQPREPGFNRRGGPRTPLARASFTARSDQSGSRDRRPRSGDDAEQFRRHVLRG